MVHSAWTFVCADTIFCSSRICCIRQCIRQNIFNFFITQQRCQSKLQSSNKQFAHSFIQHVMQWYKSMIVVEYYSTIIIGKNILSQENRMSYDVRICTLMLWVCVLSSSSSSSLASSSEFIHSQSNQFMEAAKGDYLPCNKKESQWLRQREQTITSAAPIITSRLRDEQVVASFVCSCCYGANNNNNNSTSNESL